MNHRAAGRASVDLYLINASLPEVGESGNRRGLDRHLCRRQACLAGQELLLVTAITFPHPRSQPTSYSPLRAVHISCKGARITSAGYCVHGYPMEGASANNILSKA
ncbi:hypothetical protein Bca4012_103290 [Brassica carinata]